MSALALQTVRFISDIVSVWETDSWMEIHVLITRQQYCASTNYHWESRQTSLHNWKKILFAGIWAVFCRLHSAQNLQIKRIALVINLTEVIPEWRIRKISYYLIKWKAARSSPLCWGEVGYSISVYTSSCRRKCVFLQSHCRNWDFVNWLCRTAWGEQWNKQMFFSPITCHSQHWENRDCISNPCVSQLFVLPDTKLGGRVVQAIQV